MESDEDSHSSSNSSESSNSSSNGPASPPPQGNESNDQHPEQFAVLSGDDSNSAIQSLSHEQERNHSMSPVVATTPQVEDSAKSNDQSKDDEEEIELSDIDEEDRPKKADISHEDLSDISDLESSNEANFTDLRQKLEKQRQNGATENLKKIDEEELDFEDEEEIKDDSENVKKVREVKENIAKSIDSGSIKEDGEHKSDKEELESGEELEDGEVTDGDEKRPEESEPKAVCRFFTRGQCTWGMSCRFLHPGTTDKGNYTMFDMVRPTPQPVPPMMMPAYDYRTERPPLHHLPPHAPGYHGRPMIPPAESETAWERGLRTAKEMMRKASKRKEQDMDFDEKKMNLSGPPDVEVERDPYYRGSPDVTPPPFERERERMERRLPPPVRSGPFSPPAKFSRGAAPFFEEDQYGRMARSYRELPAHRMPHYEDDDLNKRRTVRTTREVIVEKADEWNDPWMRKDNGKEKKTRGRERSYSSNSSYSSSSSSSRSHSSSDSSGSATQGNRRRSSGARFDAKKISKEKIPVPVHHKIDRARSSSLKRRHHSPVPRTRIGIPMKKPPSPIPPPSKRKKPSSPAQRDVSKAVSQRKKRDSSSGSSSGSETGSSYSSSTSDSKGKKKREKIVSERKPSSKKEGSKKHPTTPPSAKDDEKLSEKAAAAAKLKTTRREELLKQLRAVEDAIARKRSKIK